MNINTHLPQKNDKNIEQKKAADNTDSQHPPGKGWPVVQLVNYEGRGLEEQKNADQTIVIHLSN